MPVFCQNCGTENTDPGGPVEPYHCGRCGHRALVRIPEFSAPKNATSTDTVLAAILGAGIGGSIAGPAGALVGGLIGAVISGSKK